MATILQHPTTTTLSGLVAHAYAASLRFNEYSSRPDLDEDEFGALEQADFDARRAVRAKLAEIGVDPAMLARVVA